MSKTIAHVDLDFVKYGASAVGEKRSIIVTHKPTGKTKEFDNKTEFYGRDKNHTGGWLAELNKDRTSPFTVDEFEIEEIQTIKDPIVNILHSAKMMVEGAIKKSGASSAKYYIGEGESFRVELSTLLKYKNNRKDLARPLMLDDVVEYLKNKFRPEIVTHYEVDDVVVMNTWNKRNHFIVGLDKDYLGAGTRFFNTNKPELGIIDCTGFGELVKTDKGVTGRGRLFKYWQITSQDLVDNYKANCFSDVRWGEASAYKALVDCKDDKEAFEAMLSVFNKLYPEPKTVIGWREKAILIDSLYVFQEMMDMVHMQRWKGDRVIVKDVMDKLGIKY